MTIERVIFIPLSLLHPMEYGHSNMEQNESRASRRRRGQMSSWLQELIYCAKVVLKVKA